MPRRRTRTQPQGDASRLALLEATLRLAGERGYVGTTMAQVTRATGLPASSVYWHFANKDELIADAVAHGFETWRSSIDPWTSFDTDIPRAEQLLAEFESVVLAPDDRLGYWRMGLLLALETGPAVGSTPRERFLGIRDIAINQLTSWWAFSVGPDGPRARTLARLTLAALDGLFVARLSDPTEDVHDSLHLLAAGLDAVARQLSDEDLSRAGRGSSRRARPLRPTQDSRLKLLRAAGEVAAESGYDGASIARICAAAGLPASSLYWHFADKDDLLAEVVDHSYEEWYADQPAWDLPADGTPWDDALRGHLARSMGSLATQPIFLRLGYHLLLLRRDDPPAARARFVDVRVRARRATADWFAGAVPDAGAMPQPASMLLMALSDGLFFSNQLDSPPSDTEIFSDLVTRVLAAGAQATVPS